MSRRLIVTGGSRGLGRSIALKLAEHDLLSEVLDDDDVLVALEALAGSASRLRTNASGM